MHDARCMMRCCTVFFIVMYNITLSHSEPFRVVCGSWLVVCIVAIRSSTDGYTPICKKYLYMCRPSPVILLVVVLFRFVSFRNLIVASEWPPRRSTRRFLVGIAKGRRRVVCGKGSGGIEQIARRVCVCRGRRWRRRRRRRGTGTPHGHTRGKESPLRGRSRRIVPLLLGKHLIGRGRGKHFSNHDSHSLDERQQDPSYRGGTGRGLGSRSQRKGASGGGARNDGIPGVFLLSQRGEAAVVAGKDAAPYSELASQDGGPCLNGGEGSREAGPGRGHSRALDGMPEAAPDVSHAKGASHVVDYSPRAGLPVGHSGLAGHVCDLN
mmetsp:Transcript_17125/g.47085  ORF Transcript_17125/g.47085 Transcript_17125/m.47085 type:complete len:323 (+) Transcript_17125:268-1236(+)